MLNKQRAFLAATLQENKVQRMSVSASLAARRKN
jgi:hypothetical protein